MTEWELKICDIQGRLFELSAKEGLDSEIFIKCFMNSKVAAGLDSVYNHYQWAGEEYLMEELEADEDFPRTENICDENTLYWIGYLYRYWCIWRKLSSKKVLKWAPAQTMRKNYYMFHSMDPQMAIEDLEEIYRQRVEK